MTSAMQQGKLRRPLFKGERDKREWFYKDDRFLSVGQVFIVRGGQLEPTNMGFPVRYYRLAAKCEDCQLPFQFSATRAEIHGDRLRRRCDDCKSPGKATRAGAILARERRRKKAAEAERVRLDELFARRLQKLVEATGWKFPASPSLSELFRAEQRHIRQTRLAHQRSAKMLGVPISEILKIEMERRARLAKECS